ncbi:MAG TPA: hypothetical protein DCS35_12005 [Vibrio sp.]|nr:hypothetical protein [Vibrio sp.]
MAKRRRLTKGEKEGIQLIADLFVIRELIENVFAKDEHIGPQIKAFEAHIRKAVPQVYIAGEELQKAIASTRETWLRELKEGFNE